MPRMIGKGHVSRWASHGVGFMSLPPACDGLIHAPNWFMLFHKPKVLCMGKSCAGCCGPFRHDFRVAETMLTEKCDTCCMGLLGLLERMLVRMIALVLVPLLYIWEATVATASKPCSETSPSACVWVAHHFGKEQNLRL